MGFISFDVTATLLFNLGMDIFALLIIVIIFLSSNKLNSNTYGQRLLRRIQLTLIVVLATDAIMWIFNGKPGKTALIIEYADNMLFYAFVLHVTFSWLQYGWYRIYRTPLQRKYRIIFCTVPFILLNILSISTPWTKLVCYFDESNLYHRGNLNFIYSIFFMMYILFTSIIALKKYKTTVLQSDKNELLSISSFILAPMIGGVLQAFMYGCSLSSPATAFSMLLVYLNLQNSAVSQDGLTQLNNRFTLDRYLQNYFDSEKKENICFIMFDVNSFKSINDTYGHLNGDKALNQIATTLKFSFGRSNAFLARYGGDEFVAILRDCDESRATSEINKFHDALSNFNSTKKIPFILSVSAGFCMYPAEGVSSAKELIQQADKSMYEEKKRYHESLRA